MNVFDPEASSQSHRDGYDSLMYWSALEEYYEHSDFVNYGYWDETTHSAPRACERLMDRLLAFIPNKGGTILDVACGKGATTRHLLSYYDPSNVTGINISAKQLERCRQNAPGCRFIEMDAVNLDFPDHSFDAMICVEAAFHFVTRRRFFERAARVLKPGGKLVLSDLLMTRKREAARRLGSVENYVPDPPAYAAVARSAGFGEAEVIDATEPCLKGCFDYLVRFSHERLLDRRMLVEELRAFTRRFFSFVPDFRYYLLACLTI